jgi:hypothetical protein
MSELAGARHDLSQLSCFTAQFFAWLSGLRIPPEADLLGECGTLA